MSKLSKNQVDDMIRRLDMHPIDFEERINTLDKPLIIESACPGWQPKYWGPREIYPAEPPGYTEEGDERFPAVPITIEEQKRDIVEAVKLGAQCIHFHPRDPEIGIALEFTERNAPLMAELLKLAFKEISDAITLQHTWTAGGGSPKNLAEEQTQTLARAGLDGISDTRMLLELGHGNKYCQGAVVLWPPGDAYPPGYTENIQDTIRFFEANEVKPIHKLRSSYNVRKLKRVLIDTEVITKKPFILVHDMGHPFGWPMDIDRWMPIDMIASLEQTKERIPDSVIGVYSGGRNWMPITMTAILAGVDLIRVGIEDCYWMYPHRDDIIQSNSQVVKLIIDFANMVGRPLATVEQAREIMGMKLTSTNVA